MQLRGACEARIFGAACSFPTANSMGRFCLTQRLPFFRNRRGLDYGRMRFCCLARLSRRRVSMRLIKTTSLPDNGPCPDTPRFRMRGPFRRSFRCSKRFGRCDHRRRRDYRFRAAASSQARRGATRKPFNNGKRRFAGWHCRRGTAKA